MDRLHDWEFHSVHVDWRTGEARLEMSWVDEHHALVARGIRKIDISREFPWGQTNWIMSASEPIEAAGGKLLKIEMQSGDKIEIIAESFEFPEENPKASWQLPLGK